MQGAILRGGVPYARQLIVVALITGAFSTPVSAESQLEEIAERAGFRIIAQGESTRESEARARSRVPLNRMSGAARQRALKVMDQCSQFRRLPEIQYSADPALYQYLVRHPDVAVSTWRVLGISRFEMWQTGPLEYEAAAVDGTEGLADVLYRDHEQCIFVCEGSYHNPLLPKPLEASALVWFRSGFTPADDGTFLVTQKAEVFVAFPSQGLSAVARILTPVTNSMMDRNLLEVSLYASMMSRAVRDEPEWIIQLARQLEGVLPQRSTELITIARQDRSPRIRPEQKSTSQNAGPHRAVVMSTGISLFEPPRPEDLAGASGVTAPPDPPAPATARAAAPARSSSLSVPAVPAKSAPAATAADTPRIRAQNVASRTQKSENSPAEKDLFSLQPTILPPDTRQQSAPTGN